MRMSGLSSDKDADTKCDGMDETEVSSTTHRRSGPRAPEEDVWMAVGEGRRSLHDSVKVLLTQLVLLMVDDEKVPRNILLVGKPSAGKSSLINLFKSALLGRYAEVAQPGSASVGNVPQFTDRLTVFPNMGLTQRELSLFKNRIPPEIGAPEDFKLPTLIDMPGLENNPKFLLKCILEGIVPEHANLSQPMRTDDNPETDFRLAKNKKVEHVVFVSSVTQDVSNQQFLDAFELTFRQKTIPYSLIFTHMDYANEIPENTLNERFDAAKAILCISKDAKLNSHCVSNYCDKDPISETEHSAYEVNLEKHKEALIALKKILRARAVPVPTRPMKPYELKLRRIKNTIIWIHESVNWHYFAIGILTVVVFILIVLVIFKGDKKAKFPENIKNVSR